MLSNFKHGNRLEWENVCIADSNNKLNPINKMAASGNVVWQSWSSFL
jgi:hypothetical protein